MKKIIVSFVVFFMIMSVGFNNIAFSAEEQGYVSVNTSSEMELTPDVIDFSVEIVTTSKDSMSKAVAENKRISAKVYEDLKKSIDTTKGDSLKTSNYNTHPVYRYNNNKRILDYYQVTNNIKVHTKKITEVGKLMDIVTEDGATSVNNISYSVSQYDEECNKLIAQTAKKAKQQAQNIASAVGSQITGVKAIDGSCSLSGKNVMPRMMLMSKALGATNESASMDSGTNIEVGTMTLYARVNASFYLK